MYKIRVILDVNEDVIRTILVNDDINLEALHNTIHESFGFSGNEMASFYRSDDEWNQGEEIPLFDMSDNSDTVSMRDFPLIQALPNKNAKLIYVYDFLSMWTFYVDVIEISNETREDVPKTILAVGKIPDEAPEKEFTSDKIGDGKDDPFDDELDYFDDFDFPNY